LGTRGGIISRRRNCSISLFQPPALSFAGQWQWARKLPVASKTILTKQVRGWLVKH